MNVADFIEAFRSELADKEEPPLWSDDEIAAYLNEAVQEACERAYLIEDRSTLAVCAIALQPGVDTYSLHSSVFEIKRLTYQGRPLCETSVEALDAESPGWEARQGQPRGFIFEQASGVQPARVRLVPTPNQAGAVALTVYRGALKPLNSAQDNAKPEIHESYHARLKDWIYRCAFLKQDSDTQDKSRAAEFAAQFTQSFGERPDANVQRKQRDRSPPVVRCSW